MAENSTRYEIGQDKELINIEGFEGYVNGLDEFEAIVEAGSNGLNLFLSSKVGLFLGDGLYSCTKGLNAHTIREVPVLDVIVMNFNQVELF